MKFESEFHRIEGFNFGEVIKQSEAEEKRARSKNEIIDLLRTLDSSLI